MRASYPTLTAALFGSLLLCLPSTGAGAVIFDEVGTTAMIHDQIAPDVRSRALGRAVVAVPEGPADIWWNPAALPTGQTLRFQYVPLDWIVDTDLSTFALAAEWRGLRLGLARTTFGLDGPGLHEPVLSELSNGDDDDFDARTWTINAGADLASWICRGDPRYDLAVGVNVRRLSNRIDSDEEVAWDMDVGLVGSRRWESGGTWWRVSPAAMVRNVLGSDVTLGDRKSAVRSELRFGLAGQAGHRGNSGRRHPLQALVAYARVQNLNGHSQANSDHYGLELTLFELLSPRAGYATRGFPRFWSGGCGLRLAEPTWLPLGLTVDYARENWDELGGWRNQWAVTLTCDLR